MRTFTLVFVAVCFIAAVSAFPADAEEPKLEQLNPIAAAEVEQGEVDAASQGDRAKRQYYGGYSGYGYPSYYGGYGGGYGGRGGYYGGRGYYGGHRGYYGGHRGYGYGGYGR